ncbi:MAG: F0F1 ATP synthase subunit B [bacterium]
MGILENLGINWKILLGQIINFLVVLYVLRRFAYRPFLSVLAERKKKIESGVKKAEEAEAEIKLVREQKDKILRNTQQKATQILRQSEDQAKVKTEQILSATQVEREVILKEAEEEGRREVEKMQKNQREEVLGISLSLAEKILQEKIDIVKDKEIVEKFLTDLRPAGEGQRNEG